MTQGVEQRERAPHGPHEVRGCVVEYLGGAHVAGRIFVQGE